MDGSLKNVGIKEALRDASHLREIYDQSPLITTALHKLLLAILHRIFGPRDLNEWCSLWEMGEWNISKVAGYLDKWRNWFFLIDDQHPFYQDRDDFNKNELPVTKIAHEMATGNNDTLFDHHYKEKEESWPLDKVARYIVTFQQYAVGGTQGKAGRTEDGPLVRGVTVMALGSNLFQTLALNLVPLSREYTGFDHTSEDLPGWERVTARAASNKGIKPLGYLDYLTWPSVGLRMIYNTEGKCEKIKMRQNLASSKDYLDPMKSYKKNAKGEILPVRFSVDRALWRDSAAIFRVSDIESTTGTKRPAFLDLIQNVIVDKKVAIPPMTIVVTGMQMNKAKIMAWCLDRLPFELDFITRVDVMNCLDYCIKISERVANLFSIGKESKGQDEKDLMPVRYLLKSLGFGKNDLEKEQSRDSLGFKRIFWSSLGVPFQELTHEACIQPDLAHCIKVWKESLKNLALTTFYFATKHLLSSPSGIKAQIIAEKKFKGLLDYTLAKDAVLAASSEVEDNEDGSDIDDENGKD